MRLNIDDFPEMAVPEMQQTHAEDVAMINELCELLEALESGHGDLTLLDEKLDGLLTHTEVHFANEERLMRESGFPPLPVHKGAHDLLLNRMEQAIAEWKDGRELPSLAQFLRHELPDWMREHIGTMDFVTAGFISMHG